jgi:Bacterial CdiA-CT RNAse A domain
MYRPRNLAVVIAYVALVPLFACSKPSRIPGADATPNHVFARATTSTGTLLRDLSHDESLGGHTLARHVGKTDEELRDRLSHEHISAASTYTDRTAAERAVGSAVAVAQNKIGEWVSASGSHPNLVLDYDSAQPIGRSLHRRDTQATPCSHAVVVLKWRPPADYFVLTSYPECT